MMYVTEIKNGIPWLIMWFVIDTIQVHIICMWTL